MAARRSPKAVISACSDWAASWALDAVKLTLMTLEVGSEVTRSAFWNLSTVSGSGRAPW
jgi:hypothetical protein